MTTTTTEAKLWDARFIKMLKKLAPGTALRDGLENILRAKMGALILIDDSPETLGIVDCGFAINVEYTPSNFYELAKMDGALVMSSDGKRILHLPCDSILLCHIFGGDAHVVVVKGFPQTVIDHGIDD